MSIDGLQFRLSGRIASRNLQGDRVLLDLQEGRFFVSRGIGRMILQMLEQHLSLDEIVSHVTNRYPESSAHVRRDIEGFIADLKARGFIEPLELGHDGQAPPLQ